MKAAIALSSVNVFQSDAFVLQANRVTPSAYISHGLVRTGVRRLDDHSFALQMHSGQTEVGQQECHCVPTGLRCLSGKLKRRIGKPEQNVVRFDVKLDNVSVVQELDSRGDVIHPALDYWMGKKCIEQLAKIIIAYGHQDEHR